LDNATFHKSEETKRIIESAGCRLIFLPPYSPDLNPIEVFWANLKAKIKSIVEQHHTIQNAIDAAFNTFIPQVL
jgi:transposase